MTWPWAAPIQQAAKAAAKDCGVKVVPWHDWKYAGHGTTQGRLAGTLWHHTVTPFSWSDAQLLRLLRQGHSRLPGPICNVGIGTGGNILLVAAGTAWHAGSGRWDGIPSGNLNTVGIEVQSPGNVPFRNIQLDVTRRFVFHLHNIAGLPSSTSIGHKEWAPSRKVDPFGVDMPFERTLLRRALTAPDPEPEDWLTMATPEDLRRIVREEIDAAFGGRDYGSDMARLRRSVRALADAQGLETTYPVEAGYKVEA